MTGRPLTARDVKNALYARHFASSEQMPGPWTCIEEWRNIDLVAFSSWASSGGGRYDRVGYEVKVSRSDLRAELLHPEKRARNVAWCNEFYLAVPRGLLTDEEIAFEEPADWTPTDFVRPACDRPEGPEEYRPYSRRRKRRCREHVPVPAIMSSERLSRMWQRGWTRIPCRRCGGGGELGRSRVEREAPTLWVPSDVGLVVVDGRGTKLVKKAPRRKDVPQLAAAELGQLVRWVSMRPDPRHAPRRERHVQYVLDGMTA